MADAQSHVVYLRRRPNNTKLPDDLCYEANRKLGASFRAGTRDILRGLNVEEENKYLPEILGVGPNEPGYRKAKEDYWCNVSLIVESGIGTPLEIGLDSTGEPISLNDWIMYKYASKHFDVAANEKELADKFQCKYFIHDPKAQKVADQASYKVQKKAAVSFLKISDDEDKMRMVLRLLGVDPRPAKTATDVEVLLDKIAKSRPDDFLKVLDKPDLELEAFIEEAVTAKVLTKVGNAYLDGDDMLGNTLQEAVIFLKDPAKSGVVTRLKARLEQVD